MRRPALITLHALIGASAVAAGQAFVRDPSGAALGMKTEWLRGSPFPDYRTPGGVLAAVIGGTNLASAYALSRRVAHAPLLSLGTGLLLLAWIAIQTVIIGWRHWSQGLWWAMFALVTVLAARLAQDDLRERRASWS